MFKRFSTLHLNQEAHRDLSSLSTELYTAIIMNGISMYAIPTKVVPEPVHHVQRPLTIFNCMSKLFTARK